MLLKMGIAVTGVGKNLAEAREPAVVERQGVTVGFLGYSSVTPEGGAAGRDKPGIATLRVRTSYEAHGPHSVVRVLSEPDERDVNMIVEDITKLRSQVDVVMVAFHGGVVWVPRIIPDYQVTVAHACVDAGADLIMVHHAHVPKAVEVYKGKAVFYGLGNFCMTKPTVNSAWQEPPWKHGVLRNHADLDPDYPLLPYGRDAQRALVVKAQLSKSGVEDVSFLPLWIDRRYRPEPLRSSDDRFADVMRYVDWASEGFDHSFEILGDEVRVRPATEQHDSTVVRESSKLS
jgi:poly-gamma-glutamate synthesis protein (capsule biosynthesis protein)